MAAPTILVCGKGLPIATIPLSSVLETDSGTDGARWLRPLLCVETHAAGPAGVLPPAAGDRIRVTIDPIGTLENDVAQSWPLPAD
jgi:hypothetical protein